MKKHLFMVLLLILSICTALSAKAPKYVFYFIGDGMGLTQVVGTQYFLRQQKGELGISPLCFARFPYTGIATSYSSDSDVTDSAASGTALASGKKTDNGMIGMEPDMKHTVSIAEKAHALGVRVGIATSVSINHATPASFYAHQKSRNMYYAIGKELPVSGFEFFAGGGFDQALNPKDKNAPSLYDIAEKGGYQVIRGYDAFRNGPRQKEKLILVQKEGAYENNLPYAIDAGEDDLTLTQITEAALEVLYRKNDSKGFFLMVEGGRIDQACHMNDAASAYREVVDFDSAIKVAKKFYDQHPDETLIVITADHETGGMALGTGRYAINLGALAHQKVSRNGFSRVLNRLRHESRDQVSWEMVKKALSDNFGFWDEVRISTDDEKALYECYQDSFVKNTKVKMAEKLYYKMEPMSTLAVRIMSRAAMVGWTTGGHTAGYIPVFAIGNGAEYFSGQSDNAELPVKIANIAGYQ